MACNRTLSNRLRWPTLVMVAFWAACGLPAPGDEHDPAAENDSGKGHDDDDFVRLGPDELKELEIEIAEAGPARLELTTQLPGEVHLNADRMAQVVPRVGGVVREVFKTLGDHVRAGEVIAILESRELADAKAAFLAARERLVLADATFKRKERLWNKQVTSEGDFLDAKNGQAEARIELRAAQQKLLALGFSQEYLRQPPDQHGADFTRYELTTPLDGIVIDKHIALGETVAGDATVFVIADLTTVWIDFRVFQKDLGRVRNGQRIYIANNHGDSEAVANIDFVQPLVGEDTRTALARVILPNPNGVWHPGCFVTGRAAVESVEVPVAVPRAALQQLDEEGPVVFVATDEGLEPRSVTVGRRDARWVEILTGLEPGERFAATNSFVIKAELGKGSFGGHVH